MIKILIAAGCIFVLGCGVKGKPQAPLKPALLGRGKPSFTKATESMSIPGLPKKKIEGDFEDQNDFKDDGDKEK